jgi:hypothetical protein
MPKILARDKNRFILREAYNGEALGRKLEGLSIRDPESRERKSSATDVTSATRGYAMKRVAANGMVERRELQNDAGQGVLAIAGDKAMY